MTEEILGWEFIESTSDATLALRSLFTQGASPPLSGPSKSVNPGRLWRAMLVDSDIVSALSNVYQITRQHYREASQDEWEDIGHGFRQTFIRLCSINGKIFHKGEEATDDVATKSQYINSLIQVSVVLMTESVGAHSAAGGESDGQEILELCQLYQSLVSNFGLSTLLAVSSFPNFLDHLSKLTCWLLGPTLKSTLADTLDTWATEAFDIVMEGWVVLLVGVEEERFKRSSADMEQLDVELARHTSPIFEAYLKRRLWAAEREALATANGADESEFQDQFHDEAYMDEHLSAIGRVARITPAHSLVILTNEINERVSHLASYLQAKQGGSANVPIVAREQLYYLIYLLGYTLADGAEGGDVPMVPTSIMHFSAKWGKENPSAVDPVSRCIESVCNYCTSFEDVVLRQPHKDEALSPLLSSVVVWFFQRWSATYLMFDESVHTLISPSLYKCYGEQGSHSANILNFIVQKACTNLLSWPEEHDLALATCDLLYSLCEGKRVKKYLSKTASWTVLLEAYQQLGYAGLGSATHTREQQQAAGLLNLNGGVLGKLVLFLCMAAGGSGNPSHLEPVLKPIEQRLGAVLNHPQFSQNFLETQFISEIETIAHMLRGVARCSGRVTFHITFAFLTRYFDAFVKLITIYTDAPHVSAIILRIFDDIAESELMYMEEQQALWFMRTASQVVQVYSTNAEQRFGEAQQLRVEAKRRETQDDMIEEDEEEHRSDLFVLLSVLTHIGELVKDPFNCLTEVSKESAAEALFVCMTMLVPYFKTGVLAYPDICERYFGLLHTTSTVFPHRFASLTHEKQSHLLECMYLAISHATPSVQQAGLRALNDVVSFRITGAKDGGVAGAGGSGKGVGAVDINDTSVSQSEFGGQIRKFQQALFNMLLFQHIPSCVFDSFADALFPLILADFHRYKENVGGFISQQPPHLHERLSQGFSKIIESNGLTTDLTRANRQRFRKNIREFVQNVRGLLQRR